MILTIGDLTITGNYTRTTDGAGAVEELFEIYKVEPECDLSDEELQEMCLEEIHRKEGEEWPE